MNRHVLDQLGAYALDALDEAEATSVAAHLAGCASCRAEYARQVETAGHLADLNPADPPPQLRSRVLAAVVRARAEPVTAPMPRRRMKSWVRWAQVGAALALAAVQVWLIATLITLQAQVALQGEAQTILLSSNETPVDLQSPDVTSAARGVFHYEPDLKRGLINYYHLLPLEPGRSYACWLEFAGQATLPCGQLSIDSSGAGLRLLSWPDQTPSRIRVTLETGSPATPQGPTILLGAVPP